MIVNDKPTGMKIELKPKPNCKYCFGKGYIKVIRPDLDASKYRELRPCSCIKAVIDITKVEPEVITKG
jgi:hypothetical protein